MNGKYPKQINLDVWDTAGQEEYGPMCRNFFAGAHAVIVVFSITSPGSFKSIENHINNIDNNCSSDVIKVIAGNKSDLESERMVSYEDMKDKASELEVVAFETSAIESRKNTINDMFTDITLMILKGNVNKVGVSGSFKVKADRRPT